MNIELTENQLNTMYDQYNNHKNKLMTDLKNETTDDFKKIADKEKEIKIIDTILLNILRLRNLKKKLELKNNL